MPRRCWCALLTWPALPALLAGIPVAPRPFTHTATPATGVAAAARARPALYRIDLRPTAQARGASGVATLTLAETPFSIPLSPDGHILLDIRISVSGLPAPSALGPYSAYVAWISTRELDHVERLGVIAPDGTVAGRVDLNKYLVIVTAEGAPNLPRWRGPIVLLGNSASSLMLNFASHPLFNGGMTPP
jgi:hypothetical protein